jgi:hypothetical protein
VFFWRKQKPSCERAMDWFKANMVPGQGIIVHTRQPVPYPAIKGNLISANYNNKLELARPTMADIDPIAGLRYSCTRTALLMAALRTGEAHRTVAERGGTGVAGDQTGSSAKSQSDISLSTIEDRGFQLCSARSRARSGIDSRIREYPAAWKRAAATKK